jgi:hypothetical protein
MKTAAERRRRDALDELVRLAGKLKIESEALDDLVYDAKLSEASEINNSGLEGQITFLIKKYGAEAAHKFISEVTGQLGG